VKFVLFVEGDTERALPAFSKRWLDQQLPQPVGIKTVRFAGWSQYHKVIAQKVSLNLTGDAGKDVIAAIGLLDLYGPTFCPAKIQSADERYEWAKVELEQIVGHQCFHQHFAVHETEAWLLSEPGKFPPAVREALSRQSAASENVNFDEPPATLLGRLYWEKLGKRCKKVIDGADLFAKLNPAIAYSRCPSLAPLLDDMLALAHQAEGDP